jgi:hypothetical protein
VQGLTEGNTEGEDDEYEREPEAPAPQLFMPSTPASVPALDRAERHDGP